MKWWLGEISVWPISYTPCGSKPSHIVVLSNLLAYWKDQHLTYYHIVTDETRLHEVKKYFKQQKLNHLHSKDKAKKQARKKACYDLSVYKNTHHLQLPKVTQKLLK